VREPVKLTEKSLQLSILGTRGIPAHHGGFETFTEHLALYLTKKGWEVTVYCQVRGKGKITEKSWKKVRLVYIPINLSGPLATVIFDWKSALHAMRNPGLIFTLGYNTALFTLLYKLTGKKNIINMDGIEWRRQKWNYFVKTWFYLNERIAIKIADHLIADHPEIFKHLMRHSPTSKITMIPYGAEEVREGNESELARLGVKTNKYVLVIARPEPENSILEIVKAYTTRRRRMPLVVLGEYIPQTNAYHKQILAAANEEVIFPGAIYSRSLVNTLRFCARLYVHGHTAGGTNPSLVEALGAGCPVLAHDNRFNRWVIGPDGLYFRDETDCAKQLDWLLADADELARMRLRSRARHRSRFTWNRILISYEELLYQWFQKNH